ncbi:MAG TPA: lamin tail domain-containing protein [Candidatus Nanoarchaeia archaeon]|nr:lamin tail domain-containing protein [Candidatus Nanoarchaeia archaeon]
MLNTKYFPGMSLFKRFARSRTLIWIAVLLLVIDFCAAYSINEVMYDPDGNDNNREFIEISFAAGDSHDLSGFVISDSSSNDTLYLLNPSGNISENYAIIVEEGFNYSSISAAAYGVGATIGDNLNNDADALTLYGIQGISVASASYSAAEGLAIGNCKSIERNNSGAANYWAESMLCGGTPGRQNSVDLLPAQNTSIETNTTTPINITGNATDPANTTSNLSGSNCGFSFALFTDKQLYSQGETVKISFALETEKTFSITYWAEGLHGEIAKTPYTAANTNQKSWTPDIDLPDQSFFIKANFSIDCGDGIFANAQNSSLITVKGAMKSDTPSINITEIYSGSDGSFEFGEMLRARINVFKGSSSSSTVEAWVEESSEEKISETVSLQAYEKYTDYDLTLSLPLKLNCKGTYDEGAHILVIQGFGIEARKEAIIRGNKDSACAVGAAAASTAQPGAAASQNVQQSTTSRVSYSLTSIPETASIMEDLKTQVTIKNDDEPHDFEVWSYVYRGSKSYSGEREQNKKQLHLEPGETADIELLNRIDDAESGEYKYKARIRKDSQKTVNEITKDILLDNSQNKNADKDDETEPIVNPVLEAALEISAKRKDSEGSAEEITGNSVLDGGEVFSSASARAARLAPWIFAIVCLIGAVIGVRTLLKKDNTQLSEASADDGMMISNKGMASHQSMAGSALSRRQKSRINRAEQEHRPGLETMLESSPSKKIRISEDKRKKAEKRRAIIRQRIYQRHLSRSANRQPL